jgi:protein required for attachment to host cells
MHAPKVLYVLADGGRARFIERNAAGAFTTFREIDSAHLHDASRQLGRRPPARVQESASPARHAIEPALDPRAKIEKAFIASIAEGLNHDEGVDRYDMLVVAAPARLLIQFRKELSGSLLNKLQTCINKDLTKIPDRELSPHLPTLFARRAKVS